GGGINPSYYIAFFSIMFLYFFSQVLSDYKKIRERLTDLIFVAIIIILINAFWTIPTLNYIKSNISIDNSIDKIGFNNWVDSLSENTSILNVLRVQGIWDWYVFDGVTGTPYYIP